MVIFLYSHIYFCFCLLSFLFSFLFLFLVFFPFFSLCFFLVLYCSVLIGSNHNDIINMIVMTIVINPVVQINCITRLLLFIMMLLLPCLALFSNVRKAQKEWINPTPSFTATPRAPPWPPGSWKTLGFPIWGLEIVDPRRFGIFDIGRFLRSFVFIFWRHLGVLACYCEFLRCVRTATI